ncbi:MAG TPA: DUF4288 domain-containing protein [Bacteroidia bacterium]|jgi:hypothetical protein|nr:DUF4288 domain-containing protein [Bacteroidia bacterium]
MYWFISKIVFRIIYPKQHGAQFDEQLRLIQAENESAAFARAQEIGFGEEESFEDASHRKVQWTFIGIAELYRLGELKDGLELASRTDEPEQAEEYMSRIRFRSQEILKGLPLENLYNPN